ncbi:MAG: hypothetical protein IJ314_03210 [Bacteroidales bacterium]|nr:hypothetical protein [Bacteroidales bacterium]
MKRLLFVFCSALAMSCSHGGTEKLLKELDALVENRLDIYAEYEAGLQELKDSLTLVVSLEDKWALADRLYDSYAYFNLDSAEVYLEMQKKYASLPRQECLTALNEIQFMAYRHNEKSAEKIFLSLDTAMVRQLELQKEFYMGGIMLYSNIKMHSRHLPTRLADQKLSEFREKYLSVDSTGFFAQRTLALLARNRGDNGEALRILDSLATVAPNSHEQSFVAFNQADIYGRLNDTEKMTEALVRSAKNDIRSAVRTYLSLYTLALMQYESGSLKRANLYISANMTDAIAGGFNTRMINAGTAQMIITEATREEEDVRNTWILVATSGVSTLLILVSILLVNNIRHARRLKSIKNRLLEINSRLKESNMELKLANKIKDSYVFSYMELSINYLRKLEESRREVRSRAKAGGLDAVLKYLRSPLDIYEEYKHYYKVFDEAFLGIFPDFREKVNALLREESRFPIPDEPVLCTELRLLAAIRLGITESGKIATFLNCAPTTVYTYRTRLKRAAICPKEEFEALISVI